MAIGNDELPLLSEKDEAGKSFEDADKF